MKYQVCLSVFSVFLYVYLFVYLSVHPLFCLLLSVLLPVCHYLSVIVCLLLSVSLSVTLLICLSIYMSVCYCLTVPFYLYQCLNLADCIVVTVYVAKTFLIDELASSWGCRFVVVNWLQHSTCNTGCIGSNLPSDDGYCIGILSKAFTRSWLLIGAWSLVGPTAFRGPQNFE